MTPRLVSAWTAAALALGLAACGGSAEEKAAGPPSVTVVVVEGRRVVERIQATGELLALDEAEVAAEVGGRVTEVRVDEGEQVEAGQALLEIDPERRELELASQRARLAEAEATLVEQRRDTARIRSLAERKVASDAQLDTAETQLRLARARAEAARAELGLAERAHADSSVRAPFAGWLARRHVSEGEYVSPGQKLLDLVALDPIEVEFHVPEVDSGRVAVGSEILVRVAPYPEEEFRARVTVISPTIDRETRTLRVKGTIENSNGRLRPGLFARVDLGVSEREGVAIVPEDAILQRSDGPVVFRLAGGDHVERRVVRTGIHREGQVEIVEGVEPGDRVVVRGHAELVEGAVVSVRAADGSPLGPERVADGEHESPDL